MMTRANSWLILFFEGIPVMLLSWAANILPIMVLQVAAMDRQELSL